MLPILIYEPDSALRGQLLDGLGAMDGAGASRLRVSLSTSSLDSMSRAVESENGITLALMGVPDGQVVPCAELGERLMRRNRGNYVVYCLHGPELLDELLENCMRPAGILTAPWSSKRLTGCLNRVLEDYESQLTPDDAGETLTIEAGNTRYRLPAAQVMYLEALDKLVTLHTDRQTITVRRSLTNMIEELPPQFVRCHRAFVVNSRYIEKADFTQMLLTLANGESVPVSRGQRAAVRQAIDAQKGGA